MTAYTNLGSNGTMYPGDYITSPSDVYFGELLSDGQFVVDRGSDPAHAGAQVFATPLPSENLGSYFASIQSGNFVISTTDGSLNIPVWQTNSFSLVGSVAAISDAGTFTVHATNIPLGAKNYSNLFSDPVTGYEIKNITYDFADATIQTTKDISGSSTKLTNATAVQQTYPVSLSLNYQKTSTWNLSLSEAVTLGLKSTTDVGVPGIADEKLELSISSTTTLSGSQGGSQSQTKTFSGGNTVIVPANTVYKTTIVGEQVTFEIPFAFSLVADYQSGATAKLPDASGTYDGADGALFEITTVCLSAPGGCGLPTGTGVGGLPNLPAIPTSVPEPATWAMMLTFLPVAVMLYRIPKLSKRVRAGFRSLEGAG